MKKYTCITVMLGLLVTVFLLHSAEASVTTPKAKAYTIDKSVVCDVMKLVTADNVDKPEIAVAYYYLPNTETNLNAYQKAEKHFYTGLNGSNKADRSIDLAQAIGLIAQVCKSEPDSVNAQFLASRIYRAYGGVSYAERYYNKAIKICTTGLIKNVNCRQSHLDLAILYYAGDSRFYNDYEDYKEKAKMHAMEVIKQTDNLHRPDGRAYYQAALASFILERDSDAKHYLKIALNAGYPQSEVGQRLCQDIRKDVYNSFPTTDRNRKAEFLAQCFGRF